MKVPELRTLLKNTSQENLVKIATELYKHVPKALRSAEGGIDGAIMAILDGEKTVVRVKTAPAEPEVDFDDLRDEVQKFLENAREGNYLRPNRLVSKQERSKWRFAVMRQVKALKQFGPDNAEYPEVLSLLKDLFLLLSEGCGVYLFNTDNPFSSVGITQTDFYKMLLERVFAEGFELSEDMLRDLIRCAACVYNDRGSSTDNRIVELVSRVKGNTELTQELIELTDLKMREITARYSRDNYWKFTDPMENLTLLMMGLYFNKGDFDEGTAYYWDTCLRYRINYGDGGEIRFYCLMRSCRLYGVSDSQWLKTFERYRDEIDADPRDDLLAEYEEVKKRLA